MASEIKVDTISEKTSANGVTIDGVSLKDSKIATANSVDSDAYVDASIDNAHLADNAVDTAEIADNAVTLAKMAGIARGKLIYGDASGDPAALAVGAANEVLTHDGTDFDWAAAAGGTNTPACLVFMDANRTLSNDTLTKIEFDDEQYDTASAFDATTNYRFTVPAGEAGKYFIHFDADFNSGTTAGLLRCYLYLYKNGAAVARNSWNFTDNYILRANLNITNILELAESDYIEGYVYANDDADDCQLNLNGTHSMMFKIIE